MTHLSSRLLAIVLLAFSCNVNAADKLPVVASFSILGDLVAAVGGERVTVSTLVGPDTDAHHFDATPSDAKTVVRAKLVVVNGLGFEGWLTRLIKAANYQGELVVATNGIKPLQMADDHHAGKMQSDPHAWQDPANMVTYVGNIAAALSKVDPQGAATYQKNAAQYLQSVKEFDLWAGQQFATIPAEKRKVITSHDAFGYLGARYGITFSALQGLSTQSQASAKEMAKLIRQIRKEQIKAVYVENMTNPKLLAQLSSEAGVTLGEKLYSDALSVPGGKAPTYLMMMRYNVEQLMAGLRQN